MTDDSYYEMLGVEPGASRDELRAAYRSRVEKLEAAREGKGVTESSLQANREETARVRSAWNVLSDPFQRQRYDAQLAGPAAGEGDSDGDDDRDSEAAAAASGVELTGWRKLLAPPPPKQPRNGASAGGSGGKKPPPARQGPQPTIPLPPGVTLAEGRARGMALLFDFSVLLVIAIALFQFVPRAVDSNYSHNNDQSQHLTDVASKASDRASSLDDKVTSAKDKLAKVKKNGVDTTDAQQAVSDAQAKAKAAHKTADADQKKADNAAAKLTGPNNIALAVFAVVALLYLVPMTATTGRTLGMRRPRIKVIRVDGSPVTWGAALVRFAVPILIAVALYPVAGTIGVVLGLGLVLWGFRDPNKQGVHDKLAKTIVVNG